MTQCCLSLILLFYVKEDYNHRSVDDKDDTVLLILLFYVKEDYNSRRVDDKDDTALILILCKGRLQQQEG